MKRPVLPSGFLVELVQLYELPMTLCGVNGFGTQADWKDVVMSQVML